MRLIEIVLEGAAAPYFAVVDLCLDAPALPMVFGVAVALWGLSC